jgi:hypothetical protein
MSPEQFPDALPECLAADSARVVAPGWALEVGRASDPGRTADPGLASGWGLEVGRASDAAESKDTAYTPMQVK